MSHAAARPRPGVWLAATRPAFLSATLLAVCLGFGFAWWRGAAVDIASGPVLLLALFGALAAHAGANVLNDVADHDNGSDACNTDRVAPFTGGSRFIQDGRLSRAEMARWSSVLFATCATCGLALSTLTDLRLLWFGLGGLALGIAYSLPPFKLMARGLGEAAVAAAWLLIVAGCDFVLRRQADAGAWIAGLSFALQMGLILIVNQIPDFRADSAAGKHNLIVRLGRHRAAALYGSVMLASYLAALAAWSLGRLPAAALVCLAALPFGIAATRRIATHATTPAGLETPIRLTLLQAHLVGALLILGLLADRHFRNPS